MGAKRRTAPSAVLHRVAGIAPTWEKKNMRWWILRLKGFVVSRQYACRHKARRFGRRWY